MHRARAELDADIRATSAQLAALHKERKSARQLEIAAVCRAFDDDDQPDEIAAALKLSRGEVAGILYRNGRSVRGRNAIRKQRKLHAIAARHTEPQGAGR